MKDVFSTKPVFNRKFVRGMIRSQIERRDGIHKTSLKLRKIYGDRVKAPRAKAGVWMFLRGSKRKRACNSALQRG